MPKKRATKKPSLRQTHFYEAMPGMYIDRSFSLPSSADEVHEPYIAEDHELTTPEAKSRMLWYGLALVTLFALQIILFVLLVRSTVSLG